MSDNENAFDEIDFLEIGQPYNGFVSVSQPSTEVLNPYTSSSHVPHTKDNNKSYKWRITTLASNFAAETSKNAQSLSKKSYERLSLEGQLRQARISLQKFLNPKILTNTIPKYILRGAKGIVFLTVVKAGFLFAGNVGTGIVIVRKNKAKEKKHKKKSKPKPKPMPVTSDFISFPNNYRHRSRKRNMLQSPSNTNSDKGYATIDACLLKCGKDGNLINHQRVREWSGPSSICVFGISFGFLVGISKVDYIMILPNAWAVRQFTGHGHLRLGGEIQLALGPLGRDANASVGGGDKGISVVYSYSHAKGLYGGLALDGKAISVRPECNRDFYCSKVSASDILNGRVEPPANEDYDLIIHMLDSYCKSESTYKDEKDVDLLQSHGSCGSIDLTDVTPMPFSNEIIEDTFVHVSCEYLKHINDKNSKKASEKIIEIRHLCVHDTLMDIKMKIAQERNILNWKQIEIRNESLQLLWQDFRTLKELSITDELNKLYFNDGMKIKVCTPLNKTLVISCKGQESLMYIKEEILRREGILCELQQLIWKSKPLDENKTVAQNGLFHDCVLQVRWSSKFINRQEMEHQYKDNQIQRRSSLLDECCQEYGEEEVGEMLEEMKNVNEEQGERNYSTLPIETKILEMDLLGI